MFKSREYIEGERAHASVFSFLPSLSQIICLDLSEEMSHPRLESFNG